MNQGAKNREIKPKKVLFLITKATQGGAQKYVFDLATSLSQDEFSVEVAYGERGKLSAAFEERSIGTHVLPALARNVNLLKDVESFFQILWLLRRERPDVFHVNSSKAAALGALAARLARVPRIIFTAHGWPFKENRSPYSKLAIRCISWFTALCAHATIVVSQEDFAIGKRMRLVCKKIHYIPLGIKPPEFISREAAWQTIFERASVENPALPRIVTVAELTKNKGIRYGIDAIAALKDTNIPCNYFVIGEGELRQHLEQYAIEKEVETRVYFLGFIENAARLLKAFDVFVLPSIKEGMPYVLLEAASAGLAIVTTNAAAMDPAPNVAVAAAANARALAEAVAYVLESDERAAPAICPTLRTMVEATSRLY